MRFCGGNGKINMKEMPPPPNFINTNGILEEKKILHESIHESDRSNMKYFIVFFKHLKISPSRVISRSALFLKIKMSR